ncbi:MAG: methyltransferase domain-containing protein [Verrucomicrobiaceae bacterium]
MSASAFLREFARNWKTVGAIAPSSPALAEKMMVASGAAHARHILELGPGTGAFTEALARVMPDSADYLGLELNEAFVHRLHAQFPGMRFECCCAQKFDLKQPDFREGFDVIISGLPWTAFPEELQKAILGNVLPHLAPGGRFVTFAYFGFHKLPAGQHFRDLLGTLLPNVTTTEVVWANLPPAFVYVGSNEPLTSADIESDE